MGQHFECFWDIMKDIPALEMPKPYSILDEFRIVNENDPNISPCRIINNCGHKRNASKMGLNRKGQLDVVKLLLAKESNTYYTLIEDWFRTSCNPPSTRCGRQCPPSSSGSPSPSSSNTCTASCNIFPASRTCPSCGSAATTSTTHSWSHW